MDIYVSSMEQIAPEYHLSSRRVIDVNYHPGSGYTIPAGSIFILPKDPVGWFDYTPNDKYVVNLVDVFINEYGELCSAYDTSKTIPVPYDFDNTNEDIDCWDPAGAPVKGYIDFSTDSMAIPSLPTGVKSGYHYLCESIPYRMVFNGLLSDYVSLIWNDSFDDVGTFTLTCLDTPENRKLFVTNRYVRISKSGETMIIEKVVTNAALKNDGYLMTVSGRSLSSILDRRVAFPGIGLNTDICQKQGGIVYGINHLVKAYFIDPSIPVAKETTSGQDSFYYPKRKVPCFMIDNDNEDGTIPPNADEFPRGTPMGSVNRTVSKKDILSAVKELCQNNNLGFHVYQKDHELKNRTTGKVVFTHTVFHFAVYQGEKRTYGSGNPMVFSPMFDNVDSLSVTDDITNHKNFVFCGKEKDSDTYIDMSASGESTTSQSAISELLGSVKIISTMKNWLQTQLQDNTVTRTGVLFLAIAASRKDASYDPTVNMIKYNAVGNPEREKDTDGEYIYPSDYDDYGYTITYKKVVGASDASASGKVGTFRTSDHDGVSWIEEFKMSTAFGWLTSDIIKEATQALNSLGDGFIGTAKGLAIKAWFRGLDQYTSNYATIRWLCATHDTGDPFGDGLDRREVFVDEEAEEDDDWNEAAIHNWRNNTTLVTESQDGEETDEEILQRLKTSAVKQSGEYRKKHDIDIKCNGDTSVYRRDYFLGDVIQADDMRGNLETYVIKAVAITNDVQSGEQIVPTFDKYSVIPKDYTRLEWLQLCNMVLPVQYNPDSIEDQDSESLKTTESNLPWGPNKGVESYSNTSMPIDPKDVHVESAIPFTSIKDRRFKLTGIKTRVAKMFDPQQDDRKVICKGNGKHLAAAISVDGCEINKETDVEIKCSRDFPLNVFMTYGYKSSGGDEDCIMRDANSYTKTYDTDDGTCLLKNGRLIKDDNDAPAAENRKRGWFMTSNSHNIAKDVFPGDLSTENANFASSESYLPGFSYPPNAVVENPNARLYQINIQANDTGNVANSGKFDSLVINNIFTETNGPTWIRSAIGFNSDTASDNNIIHKTRANKVKIKIPNLGIAAENILVEASGVKTVFDNGYYNNDLFTKNYNKSVYAGTFTNLSQFLQKAVSVYNDKQSKDRPIIIMKYTGEKQFGGVYIPSPTSLGNENMMIDVYYGDVQTQAFLDDLLTGYIFRQGFVNAVFAIKNTSGRVLYYTVSGESKPLASGHVLIGKTTDVSSDTIFLSDTVPYPTDALVPQSAGPGGTAIVWSSALPSSGAVNRGDFIIGELRRRESDGEFFIMMDKARLRWKAVVNNTTINNDAVLSEETLRDLFIDTMPSTYGGYLPSQTWPINIYKDKNGGGDNTEKYIWIANYIHNNRGAPDATLENIQETKPYGSYVQSEKSDDGFEYFPRHIVLGGYRYRQYIEDDDGKRTYNKYRFDPDFTDFENGYAYQQITIQETNAVDRTYYVCETEIYNHNAKTYSETELKAQLFDTNSTRVTHVLTPVVYKGGDGDDFAKLSNEQKYGFYDETVGMFIPINYDTDGGTNPDAKFIAAGPELVE